MVALKLTRTRRRIAVRCALTLALVCANATAQTNASAVTGQVLKRLADLPFTTLAGKSTLPHDAIYAIAQDRSGFLWIGTFGGLSRFDGYTVRNYVKHPGQAGSLPDNTVRAVLARPDGSLLIGTENGGLAVYDPASDSFHVPEGMPDWMRGSHIFSLMEDGADSVWIGTQGGAVQYVPSRHAFRIFGHGESAAKSSGLAEGDIYCTLRDREGNLWLGGERGVFLQRAGSTAFLPVPMQDGPDQLGAEAPIWSLFQDSAGDILVGSDTTGIGIVDRAAGTVRGLPHLAGINVLSGPHTIRGFVEPEPGTVWAATYGGGLIRINRRTGEISVLKRDLTSPAPLANNFVRAIFLDRSGMLWAGTNDGLSYTTARQRRIYQIFATPLRPNGLSGEEVRSVGEGFGKVWVGFDQGGFTEIDADGSMHTIRPAAGVKPSQLSRTEVLAIAPVAPGKLLAAGGGLFLIDAATRTYRSLELPKALNSPAKFICPAGDTVWIGTYAGLLRYDLRSRQIKLYAHSKQDKGSLTDNNIRSILRRPDGQLWIATRHGLDRFDPATEIFRHYRRRKGESASLPSDNLQPLATDDRGRLWIGTVDNGLAILESDPPKGNPVFRTMAAPDGLPAGSVVALVPASQHRMWVETTEGLATCDTESGAIVSYGAAEGFQASVQNVFHVASLPDGTVLLPTRYSLSVIPPGEAAPEPLHGPLAITSLALGHAGASSSAVSGQSPQTIHLRSHEGFSATFADFDFAATPDIRYAYALEPYDRNPREADSRTVTYSNLPAGRYVLVLRADQRNGLGSQEVRIPVIVQALFYERLWFRALLVLLAACLVYAAIRIRTARLLKREQYLQNEVAERTAELHRNRQELLDANARLASLAEHDFLTGILNRRGFFTRAATAVLRHQNAGLPYSILLIDMDHFKALNDRFGHAAGDEALQSVTAAISSDVRTADLFARYGGEEFILFLAAADIDEAYALAQRIRKRIADRPIRTEAGAASITVSIGVATWDHYSELNIIIQTADANLYEAKRTGRNRVCVSSTEQPEGGEPV